jgi:hypothetical protein
MHGLVPSLRIYLARFHPAVQALLGLGLISIGVTLMVTGAGHGPVLILGGFLIALAPLSSAISMLKGRDRLEP